MTITFDAAHAAYLRARAELAQASASAAEDDVWPPLFETERAAVARLIPSRVRYREDMAAKLCLLRSWVDEEAIAGAFKDDRVRAMARQLASDFADMPEPPVAPSNEN